MENLNQYKNPEEMREKRGVEWLQERIPKALLPKDFDAVLAKDEHSPQGNFWRWTRDLVGSMRTWIPDHSYLYETAIEDVGRKLHQVVSSGNNGNATRNAAMKDLELLFRDFGQVLADEAMGRNAEGEASRFKMLQTLELLSDQYEQLFKKLGGDFVKFRRKQRELAYSGLDIANSLIREYREFTSENREQALVKLGEFLRSHNIDEIVGIAMSGAPVAALVHRLAVEQGILAEEDFSIAVPTKFYVRTLTSTNSETGEVLEHDIFQGPKHFKFSKNFAKHDRLLLIDDVLTGTTITRPAVEKSLSLQRMSFMAGTTDWYSEGADFSLWDLFPDKEQRV